MAEAIVTTTARKKMLQARAGDIGLAQIVGVAFGKGGVDSNGEVIVPSEDQTELNEEIFRKEVSGHEYISDYVCRYICTLETEELVGEKISEIGLYDEDGDLVNIKNFSAKGKDEDLEITFNIDDVF